MSYPVGCLYSTHADIGRAAAEAQAISQRGYRVTMALRLEFTAETKGGIRLESIVFEWPTSPVLSRLR
jgi:hypothetical protein